MTTKPKLFYNGSECCTRLLNLINKENLNDEFKFYDTDDPAISSKLPETFTRVPILIVKGMNIQLIGKEVFNWIMSRKYLNLSSIDINKSTNPEFHETPHIGKAYNTNAAAMNDKDDKKMNSALAYTEDWEKLGITNNLKKRYIDNKLSQETQQRKLQKLVDSRNDELEKIMSQNKKF